jgi:L-ascorbate metabolism protein UlaG (beta-lactamase superfamily)
MKIAVCLVLLTGGLVGFAIWLGWWRLSNWEQVTGWSGLSAEERVFEEVARLDFEQRADAPEFSWQGHATMKIRWGGVRCVVDPVAADRVKVAPRRFDRPRVDLTQGCDVILITHAHMDHLDVATLEAMPAARILLPAGTERFLSAAVLAKHTVQPIQLGELIEFGELEIIPVAARHGGWRYPWQRGLFACGYILRRQGESLFVAGDTASGDHFKAIATQYAPRTAVLPIGAYAPQWFLQCRHLNPEEALDVAEQMGVETVVPYHFGTYRVSLEPMAAPLRRFGAAALARGQQWMLPVEGSGK